MLWSPQASQDSRDVACVLESIKKQYILSVAPSAVESLYYVFDYRA